MKTLGKYEIIEEIGRGGFATVYKARDPDLDQVVAVKVLHGTYADQPDEVRRFLNEARKAVKLRQRGIVRIYAVGEDNGVPYIAMEYLPGGTLSDRLHGEPLPLEAAIAVVEQVAAALDHAHKHRLVHRDLKPANILFDDEGHAVLVDFGLVKSLAESGMTTEGTSLGTPTYMAPEQAETDAKVGARADVYALGVVTYEMLAGRVPFEAETPLSVLHAHLHDVPPDPRALNEALDRDVAAVVLKALEKTPAERHQSAGAFAHDLRGAWEAIQEAAQTEASLAGQYEQVQEAMKAGRWGLVVSLCVEMRGLDPDYRDVGTLLSLAASRLAEEEERRRQERELNERYAAALELLENEEYEQAIKALEQILDQAPDFQDAGETLEKARADLEKARLYKSALAKLADGCPDEACAHLLALLELDPDHAEAHARLPEAAQDVLAELEETQAEMERVGSENEALRARTADLEAKLTEALATLRKLEPEAERSRSALQTARSQAGAYDSLLLAIEDRDRDQMLALAEELAKSDGSGANRLLRRLETKPEGDVWTNPQDGKEMIHISAGDFLYGDEKKTMELPEFWIDRTPVTNAEYARFVAATGHEPPKHWGSELPPKEIADHPVVEVSWHDAVAYAEWAGKRLPTEEEWEKAARGTDGQEYPWGDWEEDRCNTKEAGVGGTTPVGQYSAGGDSLYGCVDTAGNVWEWTVAEEGSNRVLRGGSWRNHRGLARCAAREWFDPGVSGRHLGFRCVSPG